MFDLLKKKISGFAEKILGSAEKKEEKKPISENEHVTEESTTSPAHATAQTEHAREEKETQILTAEAESEAEEEIAEEVQVEAVKVAPVSATLPEIQQKEERALKANVGLFQKIGGMISGTVTLNADTVSEFLEEFELSLLEADVEINTAQALIEELRTRLSDKKISARENPTKIILHEIKSALREIMHTEQYDLESKIRENRPCIILILGPNGAGKTTTIAKLAHRYTKQGKKVVLASADTFRAGSIEQLLVHAEKIGVRVVKHQYGADPAAVAFDAVKAARAENADIVLIDSAGRQDTNKNLLEELKKIQRVVQPHVKLYVGESYTGQTILTQARTFDEAIGVDGFVLTKLDTDTKGGGVISLLYNLHKPILFFGIGQGYDDLISFSMDEFLDRLVPGQN